MLRLLRPPAAASRSPLLAMTTRGLAAVRAPAAAAKGEDGVRAAAELLRDCMS